MRFLVHYIQFGDLVSKSCYILLKVESSLIQEASVERDRVCQKYTTHIPQARTEMTQRDRGISLQYIKLNWYGALNHINLAYIYRPNIHTENLTHRALLITIHNFYGDTHIIRSLNEILRC